MKRKSLFISLLLVVSILFAGCTQVTEIIYKGTYTVSFNSNGGMGKMKVQSVLEEKSVKLNANEFTNYGCKFAGWLEVPLQQYDENGKALYTLYNDEQVVKFDSNVILYAQWKDNVTRTIRKEDSKKVPVLYEENAEFKYIPKEVTLYFETITDENGKSQLIEDVPFVSINDVPELCETALCYNKKPAVTKNGNVITLTNSGAEIKFDFNTKKVSVTDKDTFNKNELAINGLDVVENGYYIDGKYQYIQKVKEQSYNTTAKPYDIDLNYYNIPVIVSEGECYIPLKTFVDIALKTGDFVYNGNKLFFPLGIPQEIVDEYYSTVKSAGKISEELINFNYNELCLNLDYKYGLKKRHNITDFKSYISRLTMKDGKPMKDSFMNAEPLKSSQALDNLISAYFDDLHSSHSMPNPYIDLSTDEKMAKMTENSVTGSWTKKFTEEVISNITGNRDNYYTMLDGTKPTVPGQVLMYEDKEDSDGIVMILSFDSFGTFNGDYYKMTEGERFSKLEELVKNGTASSMELVMYAHSKIKQYKDAGKKVKAVVIDISSNNGGAVDACVYINGWIKGGREEIIIDNEISGSFGVCVYNVDTNFDGIFDSSDSILGLDSDIKIYCITSGMSFSCGNYMPSSIKGHKNVTLVGQRTSGGACAVFTTSTAMGDVFTVSSPYKICTITNGSLTSVDNGVEPDIYVNDYSNIYVRAKLAELITELK